MRYAVERHLRALERTRAKVDYFNASWERPRWLHLLEFDAVVLHTLFLGIRWRDDFDRLRPRFRWIRDAAAVKIAIPQDEYDHSDVLDEWLSELGVQVVFSNFADERVELLYPRAASRGTRFRPALTGYVDDDAATSGLRAVPFDRRPYDLVYRATRLPYWFGSHGQLKHRIAEAAVMTADQLGLRADISTREADTVYGGAWLDLLLSGRAVLGAESGSSVLDRRGEIQRQVKDLLAEDPTMTFAEIDARMPAGWDSYAFYAISPRHLEAVMTKTCQVLVEGTYSEVLQPHRHYLPVKRDLSDLASVLEGLRDHDRLEAVAQCAYDEIYVPGTYSYKRFAEHVAAEVPGRRRSIRRLGSPGLLALARAIDRVERRLLRARRRAQKNRTKGAEAQCRAS